jgi:hypothetical protein
MGIEAGAAVSTWRIRKFPVNKLYEDMGRQETKILVPPTSIHTTVVNRLRYIGVVQNSMDAKIPEFCTDLGD